MAGDWARVSWARMPGGHGGTNRCATQSRGRLQRSRLAAGSRGAEAGVRRAPRSGGGWMAKGQKVRVVVSPTRRRRAARLGFYFGFVPAVEARVAAWGVGLRVACCIDGRWFWVRGG